MGGCPKRQAPMRIVYIPAPAPAATQARTTDPATVVIEEPAPPPPPPAEPAPAAPAQAAPPSGACLERNSRLHPQRRRTPSPSPRRLRPKFRPWSHSKPPARKPLGAAKSGVCRMTFGSELPSSAAAGSPLRTARPWPMRALSLLSPPRPSRKATSNARSPWCARLPSCSPRWNTNRLREKGWRRVIRQSVLAANG